MKIERGQHKKKTEQLELAPQEERGALPQVCERCDRAPVMVVQGVALCSWHVGTSSLAGDGLALARAGARARVARNRGPSFR